MFRGGYGVLKLLPKDFYRLTPGEYADMMSARLWVQQQQQPSRRLEGPARAMELAKLDEQIARARGEHR